MINVSKLKSGIVLDHIPQGQGYALFKQLKLDAIDDVVVLMRNVQSVKMGRKDLIKIETDMKLDVDVLGLIAPGITVSCIRDGQCVKKFKLQLPERVEGILTCKNPRCISSTERIENIVFTLADSKTKEYACEYCKTRTRL